MKLASSAMFLAASLVSFSSALAGAAPAESPSRIVLVIDDDTSGASKQLRAELESLGFEVVISEHAAVETNRDNLEDVARTEDAVAALRVRPSRAGVDVWVMDRVTRKTALREVVLSGADVHNDHTVAIQAVELLRASLLEVDAPHFRSGGLPVSPHVREFVAQPPPSTSFALRLGPALLASPGGVSPTLHIDLGFRFRSRGLLGASANLLAPTAPAYVDAAAGRAAFRVQAASLRLDAFVTERESPWAVWVSGGAGLVWVHMEGSNPSQNYSAQGDDVITVAPELGVGVARVLGARARVYVEAKAAVSLPRVAVVFGDETVATWGRPFFVASTGVELLF